MWLLAGGASFNAWIGVALIAFATLAGSFLARRHADRRDVCFGAASGALIVIAGLHLLPDAWAEAREAGLSAATVPLVAITAYVLTGWLSRRGCTCPGDRETAGGIGATIALAGHRVLEGAALAITGSATVLVALAIHAGAEGLAVGTLLASVSRRRQALWLTVLCLSPALGVAITHVRLPGQLDPVLVAAAVGVLGQVTRVGLVTAFSSRRQSSVRSAAAMLAVGLVTALAVYGVG